MSWKPLLLDEKVDSLFWALMGKKTCAYTQIESLEAEDHPDNDKDHPLANNYTGLKKFGNSLQMPMLLHIVIVVNDLLLSVVIEHL